MKKLAFLFLLILCAGILAQPIQAQGCSNSLDCSAGSCGGCHFQTKYCVPYSYDCFECGPCPPWEGGLLSRKKPVRVGIGDSTLNDMGAAVLAATMPTIFRSPTRSHLPTNHPVIQPGALTKTLARANAPGTCKASVSVQVLAVSMLRK